MACLTHSNCLIKTGGRKGGGEEEGKGGRESCRKINQAVVYSTIEKVESGDRERWPESQQ